MNFVEKTLAFMKVIYKSTDEELDWMRSYLSDLDENTQKNIAFLFYKRYNSHINNLKKLNTDLILTYNEWIEAIEKLDIEDVLNKL